MTCTLKTTKKKTPALSSSGSKNANSQALGPPSGPTTYLKGTQYCVIPGSGNHLGDGGVAPGVTTCESSQLPKA